MVNTYMGKVVKQKDKDQGMYNGNKNIICTQNSDDTIPPPKKISPLDLSCLLLFI